MAEESRLAAEPSEPANTPRAVDDSGVAPDAETGAAPGAETVAEPVAAVIARVADDVLPALIARLAASDLGELEVAQAGWRVRLRRDAALHATGTTGGQGAGGQGDGSQHGSGVPGAAAHGSAGHSASAHGSSAHGTSASGSGQASATANRSSVVRRAAVSPAVGYFTARDGLATGQAVRSGDVLGLIDVLGVTQPVVAPSDGVVGRILATVGEAVEYGQELVRIDGIERLAES